MRYQATQGPAHPPYTAEPGLLKSLMPAIDIFHTPDEILLCAQSSVQVTRPSIVPNHVIDKADGAGGTRAQRSCRDGVHADLVLVARLVCQDTSVGL